MLVMGTWEWDTVSQTQFQIKNDLSDCESGKLSEADMANITKKVSWSSRGDESAGGEGTPLLNGSEGVRYTRQVELACYPAKVEVYYLICQLAVKFGYRKCLLVELLWDECIWLISMHCQNRRSFLSSCMQPFAIANNKCKRQEVAVKDSEVRHTVAKKLSRLLRSHVAKKKKSCPIQTSVKMETHMQTCGNVISTSFFQMQLTKLDSVNLFMLLIWIINHYLLDYTGTTDLSILTVKCFHQL